MSFRLKTIIGIVLIHSLLLIIITVSAHRYMYRSHEKELQQRAVTAAQLFASTTKDAVLSMDLASLECFVKEAMSNRDFAYARVIDANHRILASAGSEAQLTLPFEKDYRIKDIHDGVFDASASITEVGTTYGQVQIGIEAGSIQEALVSAQRNVLNIAALELLASLILSFLLGSYLARQLNHLKEASEKVAQGELGYQINIMSKDEIGITAKAFNQMSLHLKQSLAEINLKNEYLQEEVNKRKQTEHQLQQAHEQLEKRVEERTQALFDVNQQLKNQIKERKAAETKKQELEAQLKRVEKMEALGTLAGGVAHDLNNVLSGIVGYPDLILDMIGKDDPLRKLIENIRLSGLKASAIVEDLLTLARRGVVTTEVLNLNDIISEYLNSPEYTRLMSKNPKIEMQTDFATTLLNMEGSYVHLSKSLMNLVTNAVEAMPDGGRISIQTENRYIDKPVKGYDAILEGDYVVLTIKDQGTGISEEDQEKIFEPFYTKKVMGHSGTGLGMAVVWGTVKDHNGYIDLESSSANGSIFSLYFPCTRKLPTVSSNSHTDKQFRGKGESILVVDDISDQREIASALLTQLGYATNTVPSGESAISYLAQKNVDLVILDMIMDPGMDGLDTYKEIVATNPSQRVLIASGYSETDRVKEAQRLGAGQYIKKPYTLETIGIAVRSALE